MNFNQYVEKAMRTNFDMKDNNTRHYLLGLFNEFGELAGLFKKELFGKDVKDKIADELGDVFWYLAKGFYTTGTTLPNTYGYVKIDDTLQLTAIFTRAWQRENLVDIFYILDNIADLYGIDKGDVFRKNIKKLAVRHPEKFNIDNEKHTTKERAIFKDNKEEK
jgi:NTP pyrophosphatase (non-canonical NTP hydrolase)